MRGFDDYPVPFFYPPFPCRIGMHLNRREEENLTQRGHVPQPARIIHLGCVKIGKNERIGFQQRSGVAVGLSGGSCQPGRGLKPSFSKVVL